MKRPLLFLLLAVNIITKGQVYHPFPTDNAEWYNETIFDDNTDYGGPHYLVNGEDTVVNGLTYTKLFESPTDYLGGLREDSSKRIYFIRSDSTTEYLLYDFSLSVGDTTWVWRSEHAQPDGLYKFTITAEDSILLNNGEYRRVLHTNWGSEWIEGIGGTGGLFFDGRIDLKVVRLTCFYQNGLTVICINVGIEQIENNRVKVTVFPHPFSTLLTFSLSDNEQTTVALYNFLGQQVLQQTFTNSTTLNTEQLAGGIYFYELRHPKGILKTGKVVKQ